MVTVCPPRRGAPLETHTVTLTHGHRVSATPGRAAGNVHGDLDRG